jgi:hypothetical protein
MVMGMLWAKISSLIGFLRDWLFPNLRARALPLRRSTGIIGKHSSSFWDENVDVGCDGENRCAALDWSGLYFHDY